MRYLTVITVLLGLATSGAAATIDLVQGGWEEGGGPLRVTFSGEDTDADGALVLDELLDFRATWTTPAGDPTAWLLPDIEPDGFVFTDFGNYLFFVTNYDYSLVSAAFEGEALSSVFDSLLFPVDRTSSPAAGVPEPGAAWLVMAGIGMVAAGRLRRWRR